MESKTRTAGAGRQRTARRQAADYRPRSKGGASFGKPVHISVYLKPMLNENGGSDRKMIVERFQSESCG